MYRTMAAPNHTCHFQLSPFGRLTLISVVSSATPAAIEGAIRGDAKPILIRISLD
jgi:hypothetical protein